MVNVTDIQVTEQIVGNNNQTIQGHNIGDRI